MHSAASIHDAARRLEEASTVFRVKSRNAQEEYGDWSAQWNDARARQFAAKHLEPQRDLIEQGARLCQMHGSLVDSARATAQDAEQEIVGFFSAQSGYESATESARQATTVAREQATRSKQNSSRAADALRSIDAAIATAAADPGW